MQHYLMVMALTQAWLIYTTTGPEPLVMQSLSTVLALSVFIVFHYRADFDAKSHHKIIAVSLLAASSMSALFGLIQYLDFVNTFSPLIYQSNSAQAYANLRQRNQFATLMAIGFAALIWGQHIRNTPSISASRRVTGQGLMGGIGSSTAAQTALLLTSTLLAVAAAASGSRTGLLELLFLLALAVIWRSGWKLMLWALGAYAVGAYVLPLLVGLDPSHSGILGRLGENAAPCTSRRVLWSNVLELIAHKPWLGWGWGELDYAHFMYPYAGERFCDILDNAHNLPLHLAVELGVPAAFLFCAACLAVLVKLKPGRETQPARQMAWGVLAVIGLHSLLEYPLWYGPFQLATVLAISILWMTRSRAASATPTAKNAQTSRWLPTSLACVALLACAYVAWDYWRISQIYLPPAHRAEAYRENTLRKIQSSWLFQSHVEFAELTTTPLTPANAQAMHALSLRLLHFSPEPRVVQTVIESAVLLGRDLEAMAYLARFKAVFPREHAQWLAANQKLPKLLPPSQ